MAEAVNAPPPKFRKRKYPYEDWFTGSWMKLTHEIDFDIEPSSMANTIQSFARRNGIEAEVEVHRELAWPDKPERYVYVNAAPLQATHAS